MQYTRWNKKRVILFVLSLLILYTIFSSGYNKYQLDASFKNTKPEEVWEFVADFSKMRLLNPTILDFSITSDTGNRDHWKYSVHYKERLSHWPFWVNEADGHYSVRKLTPQEGGHYIVDSIHKTCFLNGFYCLKSVGEFKCSGIGITSTRCIETVYYQCPPFVGSLCRREVEYQRKSIMKNLTQQFPKK